MSDLSTKGIWHLFKQTGAGFLRDKVPKLSAALAYYTVFSLGPMLMVVIFFANFFWSQAAVEGRIFGQLKDLVGDSAAAQIQEILRNVAIGGNNPVQAAIGIGTLLVAATSVFAEMQDSINIIWQLKIKPEAGWFKMLKTRLVSFSLVVSLGFLLLVSLVMNGLVEGLMSRLQVLFPHTRVVLVYAVNLAFTLVVTSALFAIIYKVLPDAVIRWKDVAVGAVFTALLFMVGRFGITFYIRNSHLGSAYGTAGSLVALLLWVYFSALILYFGAEFTKCYAVQYGAQIQADHYAIIVQTVQVQSKHRTIQENETDREHTEQALQHAKDQLDSQRTS